MFVLHPYGPTENDRKRCSSYSRPIGGTWNSPKTEKKRWSMLIKLSRCKQTDSRRRNWTQQEEDEMASARKPESFVWTDNEVELRLTLCGVQRLESRGRAVGRWRDRLGKYADLHVHAAAAFLDFYTLRPSFNKVRFQAPRLQDPCGRSAKTMQNVHLPKRAFPCGRALREPVHKMNYSFYPQTGRSPLSTHQKEQRTVLRRRCVIIEYICNCKLGNDGWWSVSLLVESTDTPSKSKSALGLIFVYLVLLSPSGLWPCGSLCLRHFNLKVLPKPWTSQLPRQSRLNISIQLDSDTWNMSWYLPFWFLPFEIKRNSVRVSLVLKSVS